MGAGGTTWVASGVAPRVPTKPRHLLIRSRCCWPGWCRSCSVGCRDLPQTAAQLADALKRPEVARAAALVLDLRANPGGFFPAAVDVAQLFLPRDATIVTVLGRGGGAGGGGVGGGGAVEAGGGARGTVVYTASGVGAFLDL